MDPLEFEDIKEIFLQFKSLHKNIHEFTSKKSNIQGLSADQCYLLGLIDLAAYSCQGIRYGAFTINWLLKSQNRKMQMLK